MLPTLPGANRILTTAEVRRLVRLMKDVLGLPIQEVGRAIGWSLGDHLRLTSLVARFRAERERRSLSVKEAARRLRVPQYRLLPIVEGSQRNLEPDLFWRYVDLIDQREWVEKWVAANRTLANRLKICGRKGQARDPSAAAQEKATRGPSRTAQDLSKSASKQYALEAKTGRSASSEQGAHSPRLR